MKATLRTRFGLLGGVLAALLFASLPSWGQQQSSEPPTPPKFVRFHRVARAEATLDTAVARYRDPATRRQFSLVGAVHVADPGYFAAIQRELDSHDLVLYEMVGAPGEKRDEELAARLSLIGEMQEELAELLEFDHQRDGIDYRRVNLRHADMSGAEFKEALDARGGNLIPAEGLMRMLAPLMKLSFGMTRVMGDPQLVNRLRWQTAQSLADVDSLLARFGLDDQENPDDLIIGVRNDYAWKVVAASAPEGHQRTALFYGAAHLPDFHRRLLSDGWRLENIEWIPAWHIPATEPKTLQSGGESDPSKSGPAKDESEQQQLHTCPPPQEAKL